MVDEMTLPALSCPNNEHVWDVDQKFGPFLIYVSYDFDYDIYSIPNFKFRTTSNKKQRI